MTDRKKTIRLLSNTLRYCHNLYNHVTNEEQTWLAEINQGAKDAIVLLKEQEPVEPKLVGVNTWICGECGALLGWEDFSQSGLDLVDYKYCPECGRKVRWND